jgi:hypothetical protein
MLEGLPQTKKCAVCDETMPVAAIYCKNCGHYQSTIRRILAGVDVTALIALISSTSVALAFIHSNFIIPSNDVVGAALECKTEGFRIAFENQGGKSAILKEASAMQSAKPDDVRNLLVSENGQLSSISSIVLRPSDQRTLNLVPAVGAFSEDSASDKKKSCYKIVFHSVVIGENSTRAGDVSCGCD